MSKKIKFIFSIYIFVMFIFILPSCFKFFGQVFAVTPGEIINIPTKDDNGNNIEQSVDVMFKDIEHEWNTHWGGNQGKIDKIWQEQGKTYDEKNHWAYITNGKGEKRYFIALAETFGQAGDYVDVYVNKDGVETAFPCILGDIKGHKAGDVSFDVGGVMYGHKGGNKLKVVEIMINNYDNTAYDNGATPLDQTLQGNINDLLNSLFPVTRVQNGGSYFDYPDGSPYLTGSYGAQSGNVNAQLTFWRNNWKFF